MIQKNGAIRTEESYGPYKAMEGECRAHDPNIGLKDFTIYLIARIYNYEDESDEQRSHKMKMALLEGPVAATMHATRNLSSYHPSKPDQIFYDPEWYLLFFFYFKYNFRWIFFVFNFIMNIINITVRVQAMHKITL